MTNFDFLLTDSQFTAFASAAVSAERIYPIDASACILNCRRAMEGAVKWMYSVDASLTLPYDTRLAVLTDSESFREIVGNDLHRRMDYIRRLGNHAAHTEKKLSREQAALCLENLYIFMDLSLIHI